MSTHGSNRRLAGLQALENKLNSKPETEPTLEYIYSEQMEFARFHNGLVWQVSTVFVPFALAGFAIDFYGDDDKLNKWQLFSVFSGSIGLILIWHFLVEWHRWLWVHSFHIANLIESKWGYREHPKVPDKYKPVNPLTNPPSLLGVEVHQYDLGRFIRFIITFFIVFAWIIRLAGELIGSC